MMPSPSIGAEPNVSKSLGHKLRSHYERIQTTYDHSMKPEQIAAQLYTVRDLCTNLQETAETLKKIKTIGYSAVEVAGICEIGSDDLLKITGDAGLKICSIHDGTENVLDQPEKVVERLNALGCEIVACSYPPGIDLGNAEDVRQLVDKLKSAAVVFRAAGKRLCYHHHSVEFTRYGEATVLDHILKSVDPQSLSLELDTYWIQHGGGSPVEWCARLKNRFPILHLKDYGNTGGVPVYMEVGNGNLDWPKILAAAEASGCEWFVVEQDICPGNPLDSLRTSYENLRSRFL